MNQKLNKKSLKKSINKIAVLLFCFGLCLSGCSARQYELELLAAVPDVSFAEAEESSAESPVIAAEEPDRNYFVHICGAVVKPGVYEVASESRIFEVLALAGGFAADAAVDAVNLAMAVMDGSKILIPTEAEVFALEAADSPYSAWISLEEAGPWVSREEAGTASLGSASELTGMVNINTASLDTLMTLPGIGKAKAESIILYREEKGKFAVIEDIMKITGIKDAVFSKIKDQICV